MYIGEIIKNYRTTHNLSQRALASRTTLSPSYINTLEKIYNPKTNKPYSVTTDVANELAKAMQMTIEELLSKINDNQEFITSNTMPLQELCQDKVPLLRTVKSGYDYFNKENIQEYISVSIKLEDNNYYALKIKGDSMETIMSENDIVIIHKQEDFESGKLCVVLINDDEATVKKVYKLENSIELVSFNPAYPIKKFTTEDIKTIPVQIVGIVKQLIKNY